MGLAFAPPCALMLRAQARGPSQPPPHDRNGGVDGIVDWVLRSGGGQQGQQGQQGQRPSRQSAGGQPPRARVHNAGQGNAGAGAGDGTGPGPGPGTGVPSGDMFRFFAEGAEGLTDAAGAVDDDLDVEISEVDDTVDDGFFSRYRRELGGREGGVGPLDRQMDEPGAHEGDDTSEESKRLGRPLKGESRMNRETAVSALDAVDRLFGSLGSSPVAKSAGRHEGARGGKQVPSRSSGLNRASWLADVRSKALSNADGRGSSAADDDSDAVDVDAVDDTSSIRDVPQISERSVTSKSSSGAERRKRNKTASQKRASEDDFAEAEMENESTSYNVERSIGSVKGDTATPKHQPSRRRTGPDSSTSTESKRKEGSRHTSSEKISFSSFMDIARQGPTEGTDCNQRQARNSSLSEEEAVPVSKLTAKGGSRPRNPRTDHSTRSKVSQTKSPQLQRNQTHLARSKAKRADDVSKLLDLTKRLADQEESSDYESMDEEMDSSVELLGSAVTERRSRDTRKRRKFVATRRVLAAPGAWDPLTEEDIGGIRSDSRPLSRSKRTARHNFTVECGPCAGTGIETCRACFGSGWIEEATRQASASGTRFQLNMAGVWNRPNLVIDASGNAQCTMCNGVGKEFCGCCDGSGVGARKGFDVDDRNRIFDMFPCGSDRLHDEEMEDYDMDDDDDEDDDEEFELSLYEGPPSDFLSKAREESGDKDSDVEDQNDIDVAESIDILDESIVVESESDEVEDESAELSRALKAMHFAALEEDGLDEEEEALSSFDEEDFDNEFAIDDDDEEDEEDDEDVGDEVAGEVVLERDNQDVDDDDVDDVDVDVDDVDDDVDVDDDDDDDVGYQDDADDDDDEIDDDLV